MGGNGQGAAETKTVHTRPLSILLAFFATCLLWFSFVGTRAPHELEVGLAASILTVVFCAFARSRSQLAISFPFHDLLQAWRIPWYILADSWEMTVVLAKDLLGIRPAESLFRVAPFSPVAEDSDHVGRRALATTFTTATPSIVVIGIDVSQHRILFHQIKRDDLPVMTKNLGAHP